MATSAQASSPQSLNAGPAPLPSSDVSVVSDSYWVPDVEQMDSARRQKPWRADPRYFTSVSVSLAATVKMFLHGTRGCPDMSQGRFNWFEVMGLLIGHFRDHELVLTDSFSLPVAASEVECSMTEASQIYMANYLEYHRRLGKAEPGCVGWYHTHPGYSCFLSGIDVTTQQGSQRMQDPWVALVIDPVETLRTGHFSMKAFRTFPEGFTGTEGGDEAGGGDAAGVRATPPATPFALESGGGGGASGAGFGLPPANRIKDFGMHANRYYELPVKIVQSSRDAPLWAQLQQQFWPLSLSLTFPFAASTRTCQCCSEELARLTAALAALTSGPQSSRSTSLLSTLLGTGSRGGRNGAQQMPPLYRLRSSTSDEEVLRTTRSNVSTDPDGHAKKVAVVERRLLTLAQNTLQARTESFSLLNTSQPVHAELAEALRIISAVQLRRSDKRDC